MAFDFEGAMAAGYSVGDINDFLSKKYNFDVSGARKAGYSDDEILEKLVTYEPPPPPEPEDAGVMGRLGDAAIDLIGKGTVGAGEALVGVGDLLTGNLLGKGLGAMGYDPKATREFLDTLYTEERQAEEKKVRAVEGFLPKIKAMIEEPATILGVGLESAPQMIGGAGAVRKAATSLIKKAGITAEELLTETGKKAAQEVLKKNAGKLAAIGGAAEGAMAAGSIQEQARQEGRDWSESAGYAALGGLGTAAIGAIGGRFLPTAETALGTSGLTGATGRLSRAAATSAGEGVQETLQSAQEQAMTNLSLGRPWDEGIGAAAAMGLLAGAGMGAVTGAMTGGESAEAEQVAPPSAEEDKQERVRELTVDLAEYQRNLEDAVFSEQAINEQLAMPDITQEQRGELEQRLADIGENKAQINDIIAQFSTELESLTQTTQAPPAALNPVAPPPAAAEPTPTPPPNFANPELQAYVERMLLDDLLTLLNQMGGDRGFESLLTKQEANEIAVLKRNEDELYEQAEVAESELERSFLLGQAEKAFNIYEERTLDIARTAARRNLYGSAQQAGDTGSGASPQVSLFAGVPGVGGAQGTQQQGVGSSVGSAGQTARGAGQSDGTLSVAERQQQAAGNFKTFGAILPGGGLDLQGGQAPRRPSTPPPAVVEQDFGPPQTQEQLKFQRGAAQEETQTERPWYFSQLERSLEANGNKKAPAKQWLGVLQNTPGVKPAELEDTGVKAFLESMPDNRPVPKEDLLAFIKKGGVQIIEQEGSKDGEYRTYREHTQKRLAGQENFDSNYREMLLTLPGEHKYGSPHFDQSNVLAHVRTTDRNIDGKNVLFVEEIQSDWGQGGRKTGFAPPLSQEERKQLEKTLGSNNSEMKSLTVSVDEINDRQMSTRGELQKWYLGLGTSVPFSPNSGRFYTIERNYDIPTLAARVESNSVPSEVIDNIIDLTEHSFYSKSFSKAEDEARGLNKKLVEESGKSYEDSDLYVRKLLLDKIRDILSVNENLYQKLGEPAIPKAPFVTSTDAWTSLALKRVLTRAAQEGYDRVDFVTGKESQVVVGGGLEGQEKYYGEILPKNLAKILKPIGGVITKQKSSFVKESYSDLGAFLEDAAEKKSLVAEPVERISVEITPALKENLLGGLPLYRRQGATPAAPRLTETQTRAYVNQLTKNWKNAPKIIVVQSVKDLPDDLRGRVFDDAKGFILGDKVYVVADNAPDLNSVTGTVFHESLGHYGLKQQFQTRLDSLLKGIYDTNTAIRKATDDWRTRNADTYASLPEDQQLIRAVEEVMAEVSEAGQVKNAGLRAAINKFVAFIRDYARRMGFEVDFSNNDVAQILRQAHERVVGKEPVQKPTRAPTVAEKDESPEYIEQDKKAVASFKRSGLPPVALQEFIRYQRVMGQVDPARPDRTSIGKLRDALYGTKSRTAREIFIKASSLDMMRQLFETRNRPLAHAIRMLEKAMGRKDSSVMRGREEIEKNLRRWQGVLKDAQPQVVDKWQAIIRDSTMLQIDVEAASSRTLVQQVDNGTRTRASLTPEEDNVYALTKQFLALPSPMRQMYSELRQTYKGYYTRYFNAIAAMSPSVAAKIKQDFMANMMSVYFPLTRNGDFWVSYQDANNDTWVEAFESESERNDFVKTLNSTAGVTAINPYSKLGTADFHKSAPNSGFLADVMEKLRGANIPVQLQNQILEDYLNHLPSKSLLQQFNKRKRGPTGQLASPLGAKIDPMQAYATVASRFNNNIAVLRYTPDMETALKDAEGAFKGGNQADDLAAVTVDALKSQVATSMTPRYGVLDKAGTGVYYMTMAANVSSAFMNLFSLPMISMSVLAGKYGLGKTTKLFFGPNGVMRTMFTGGFDTNTDVMPDYTAFASGNASSAEMRLLYRALIDRSVIRRSTGFDIRDVESSDVRDYTGAWAKGKRIMGYMMHNTERFTREATAIAAYKLARDAGKSQRDAIESAIDTVHETHGTGTTETGPQLFQHGVGRMAYILKRYAHTMLWLQYKLLKKATTGADPATKKEAIRQLLYVFGTTFAVAGVRGLPTVGGVLLLTSILNGMFGDDDEPFDVEAEFDQIFGKYGKGAINAITGIEVASRTSLTDLLIRSDERRLAEVGPMLYTIEKVFGPVISIGANIERGVGQMSEGHYARGIESMAPAAARNILKGYRYYKDEARTVDGTKLIADVSKYNAFMQMAGFSDTDVMRANERARIDVKTAKFLTDRKKALYDKFFLAVFNKDEEGRKEVLEEIRAFNRKNPLVAIDAAGLRSSVKNKITGVYQSMDGVYQPPKTRLAGSKYYDFSAEREAEEEDYEEEDYDEGSYDEGSYEEDYEE